MRALIVALAIAAAAGSAAASGAGTAIWGGGVQQSITPTVPANARGQAEEAIKHDIGDADLKFRAVKASEVASVSHGALAAPVEGPVSIVCGQYEGQGQADYAWFFVAIKRGHVLWATSAKTAAAPDEAYDSCKGAGLAE